MKKIDRNKAVELSLVRYFTGKPCKHGHVAERYTINGTCLLCSRDDKHKLCCKRWRENNRDKTRKYRIKHYYKYQEKEFLYRKIYKEKNRSKLLKYSKQYYDSFGKTAEAKEKRRKYISNNLGKFRIYANNRRSKINNAIGKHTEDDIKNILMLQKNQCAYCKKNIEEKYSVDHIIPLKKGGKNDRKNIQICCISCNSKKHAKDPITFAREIGLLI